MLYQFCSLWRKRGIFYALKLILLVVERYKELRSIFQLLYGNFFLSEEIDCIIIIEQKHNLSNLVIAEKCELDMLFEE